MILSYDFFAHIIFTGNMLENCLFLEMPTSVTYLSLGIIPSRQARRFDFNAIVQPNT